MVGVGAAVDDPVHVKVEMIELGEEGFIGDDLVDFRVAFRKPAVELDGIEYEWPVVWRYYGQK